MVKRSKVPDNLLLPPFLLKRRRGKMRLSVFFACFRILIQDGLRKIMVYGEGGGGGGLAIPDKEIRGREMRCKCGR
jgi:hypothetical protein